ncbi:MAG TPA: hypothetical protein VMU11_03245 [Verrucomicrobiae bacterium]|nr:hypothetical protein [Verrucomicrobiae bacterium]
MRANILKLSTILAVSGMALSAIAPWAQARSVSAIPAADEKNFSNPVTRCNTAAMQALDKKVVNQMLADIKAAHAEDTQAAKNYQYKLDLLWDAMLQPYCGYGGYGMTAVTKSFNKTVTRARAAFLAAAKKGPAPVLTDDSSDGGDVAGGND